LKHQLRFYYRPACSLCEEMHRELLSQLTEYPFELEALDIDSSEDLVRLYDHKVPVLTGADDEEICHHFLDLQALQDYFSTH